MRQSQHKDTIEIHNPKLRFTTKRLNSQRKELVHHPSTCLWTRPRPTATCHLICMIHCRKSPLAKNNLWKILMLLPSLLKKRHPKLHKLKYQFLNLTTNMRKIRTIRVWPKISSINSINKKRIKNRIFSERRIILLIRVSTWIK